MQIVSITKQEKGNGGKRDDKLRHFLCENLLLIMKSCRQITKRKQQNTEKRVTTTINKSSKEEEKRTIDGKELLFIRTERSTG